MSPMQAGRQREPESSRYAYRTNSPRTNDGDSMAVKKGNRDVSRKIVGETRGSSRRGTIKRHDRKEMLNNSSRRGRSAPTPEFLSSWRARKKGMISK